MSGKAEITEMVFDSSAEASEPSERIPITVRPPSPKVEPAPKYNLRDLNFPQRPNKTKSTFFFGTTRTLSTLHRSEWLYLIVALVSMTGSLAITIERIISLRVEIADKDASNEQKADFTFALLLLWTTLVCFYHVYLGVRSERPYDLVIFVFTTAILMVYVIMNYVQAKDKIVSKLIRLVIVSSVGPFLIGGGLWLAKTYYVSGNLIFNVVGANSGMQKICRQVFLCDSLLLFDVQFGGSCLILWLQKSFIEPKVDIVEMIVIGVGATVTVSWVVLGFAAIRLEKRFLVYAFFALSFAEPTMIVFNLYRTVNMADQVQSLVNSTYACGILALISRVFTVYSMWAVMQNFGKGLKERVFAIEPDVLQNVEEAVAANPSDMSRN